MSERAPITVLNFDGGDDLDVTPRRQSPEELRRERAAARAAYEQRLRSHGPCNEAWIAAKLALWDSEFITKVEREALERMLVNKPSVWAPLGTHDQQHINTGLSSLQPSEAVAQANQQSRQERLQALREQMRREGWDPWL